MASYYLIPALAKLRSEINERYPNRDKSSDGWIGDASHSARPSSHNPDYAHGGAVRAIDIDVDDNDPTRDLRMQVVNAAIRDPRVWYVISNGIIWSRTYDWKARKYLGSNPHTKHVHISAVEDQRQWTNTSRWLDPEQPKWRWNEDVVSDLAPIQEQFQIAAGTRQGQRRRFHGVARLQWALGVPIDGYVGPKTLASWKRFEESLPADKKSGRASTPDPLSLKARGIGKWFRGPEAS
jgi:hypothetical protein